MLGSPLVRAFIALGVLLLLGLPLRSFTAAKSQNPEVAESDPARETMAHLQIVSTRVPFAYVVKHLGQVIWQGDSTGAAAATDVRMPTPDEGVDLALSVTWPGEGTAAAKLSLSHDDGNPVERTIWGSGSASDVLTFP